MSRRKRKPAPRHTGPTYHPTPEQILAGRSPAGGFTRATLESWGVAWPPPTGWRAALEGRAHEPQPRGNVDATVFADASFCCETGAAGWGAWCIADGKPSFTAGGQIDDVMDNSAMAETAALFLALKQALDRGYVLRGSSVMLQTDSQATLSALRKLVPSAVDRPVAGGLHCGAARRNSPWMAKSAELHAMAATIAVHDLRIITRHVKGHQPNASGRGWVNKETDRLAKAGMRAKRIALINGACP